MKRATISLMALLVTGAGCADPSPTQLVVTVEKTASVPTLQTLALSAERIGTGVRIVDRQLDVARDVSQWPVSFGLLSSNDGDARALTVDVVATPPGGGPDIRVSLQTWFVPRQVVRVRVVLDGACADPGRRWRCESVGQVCGADGLCAWPTVETIDPSGLVPARGIPDAAFALATANCGPDAGPDSGADAAADTPDGAGNEAGTDSGVDVGPEADAAAPVDADASWLPDANVGPDATIADTATTDTAVVDTASDTQPPPFDAIMERTGPVFVPDDVPAPEAGVDAAEGPTVDVVVGPDARADVNVPSDAAVDAGPPRCVTGYAYIAAGSYPIGAPPDETMAASDERPVFTAVLSAFCMKITEVTVGEFRTCRNAPRACGSDPDTGWFLNWSDRAGSRESHPINGVNWNQATEYCTWAGGRLPREAEWEAASHGSTWRRYPWGSSDPTTALARFFPVLGTAPVGDSANDRCHHPLGLCDLSGNVAEWVSDRYGDYRSGTRMDPTGPNMGNERVTRGGSWPNRAPELRTTDRSRAAPDFRDASLGFRCVRTPLR